MGDLCGAPVQVLAYSAACICVSAFSGGLIEAAKAEDLMNTLRTLTEESQQVSSAEKLHDPEVW